MEVQTQIPRLTLWWLLAALFLVITPHLFRLPLWISLLIIACVVWRILIFAGRAAFPNKALKMLIVFLSIPLTIAQYRSLGAGLDAAVCLLIMGTAFKLLEMRKRRDMLIVVSLCYVLSMVGFIYSQTILASIHALITFTVITGALISLQRENARSSFTGNAQLAIRLVAQSIPLTIVLFILVPRVAPLWTMPVPVSSNKTGVTDEMSPGNISNLSRSAELAFRVSFDATTPIHEELYWRGLVLDYFDGRAWRRSASAFQTYAMMERFQRPEQGVRNGTPVSYDIILEPTQQTWIYALPLAQLNVSDVIQDRNFTLHKEKPVTQRFRYQVQSYLNYDIDVELASTLEARALQLPEQELNPRSKQLAAQFRQEAPEDRAYALRVLRLFREEPFFYTLTPPALGEASIDEFLFSSRQGFCEHYASSFVYLMRAAGIPARVVVGYQGGEVNPFEGYTMVYQYNAHAWAEVWLEGEGWVRFDPTGAVAPERISEGAQSVLANQPGFLEDSRFSMMRFRNTQWLNSLRLRLDAMDYAWNRWVVSYDEDMQLQFLETLFGEKARERLYLVLGVAISIFFVIAAYFLLRGRKQKQYDEATKFYLRLTDDLAAQGIVRQRGEGPIDFCARVGKEKPELAEAMADITTIYVQLNYAGKLGEGQKHELLFARLRQSIRELRLTLNSPWRRLVLRAWPGQL